MPRTLPVIQMLRTLLLILTLLSLPATAAAQALDASDLDVRLEALRKAYGTPGMAVAVVKDGSVIYSRGFGYHNLERQLPVTTETAFPIGSVSKQFTASLMGLYEVEGRLSVTDQPSQHIPELRFRTEVMDHLVTIEDLLAHRSGIGNIDGALVYFRADGRQTLRIDRLAHLDPDTEVRERLDYSNGGYALLGAIAERVSGESWGDEIRNRIFEPLGMTRSSTSIAELTAGDNAATGYGMVGGEPMPALYEDLHEASPGGGINSTASDLAKWATMLLGDGAFEGTQILPADFLARAFSIHSLWEPSYEQADGSLQLSAYGYGWGIYEFEGRLQIAHGGAVSGFTARIELLPSEGIGIVVLTNQHLSGIPDWVAEIVYRQLLSLPARETESFPVNVVSVRPAITDSGSVSYREINRQRPPTHQLGQFVGDYTHPGYGSFSVVLRDSALYVDFPALSFALEHEQFNLFRLQPYYEIHVNSPSFPVNFQLGFDGEITGATIPFQSEPVPFTRDIYALRADIDRRLNEAAGQDTDNISQGVAAALQLGIETGAHSEASVNALGYGYLESGDQTMAIAVFRFNAESFPDSWNVHDSLGEALAAAGRRNEAIAAYERSLALNPSNVGGRAVLDRLRSE